MPLSVQDRLEIQELYARYSHAVDAMDGAAWVTCWTRDGEFVPSVGPTAGTPYRGHDEIRAFADTRPDEYPQARIWTTNYVFEEKDGYVEGTCYGMTVDVSGPAPVITAHYVYHDEIVKEDDGGWRFRQRHPALDVEAKREWAA
ncbi:nuclear transport factor 2 family protein [Pseudonocardia zijingensis]|jgi:uncharacterized protein (TIGR02246 family)|uniref:SnoaL-like domain-containing protein n=1 Tax=Pseudonocardia zijingensis TaxID=153376 RepID=A0ABN1N7R6_9PSEU